MLLIQFASDDSACPWMSVASTTRLLFCRVELFDAPTEQMPSGAPAKPLGATKHASHGVLTEYTPLGANEEPPLGAMTEYVSLGALRQVPSGAPTE